MKFRLALIAGCGLVLAGCSTPKIWPFYKKPKPAPEAVHEIDLVNADGTPASYPQYWKRNTLVIDLSGVSSAGTVAARLPEGTVWPVRVAVRVRPGSVEQVEVQGEERNVLPVASEGTTNVDLEFPPSVFRSNTSAIYISWGYMPQFAEVVIDPAAAPGPAPAPAPTDAAPVPPTETETPGANEIISPADAKPAQPSPPPGS